jgi:hypothetical protein
MNVPARNEPALQQLPEGYDSTNQSLAVSLAIAEVDQQVTTAHAYPRSVEVAMKHIMSLATLDEQTAQECIYALPRAGKAIKGPSIRLAEVIQGQWGNNRVGTRIVHVDRIEKYVEAEGVYHDLETNSATTARVRRRISDSKGRLFNDDMIIVTGNAASAIAKRNAILAGVPKAVWRRAYSAVEQVLVGDIKTLAERRGEALKAFAAFGVKPEQIFTALEVEGLDDIGLEEMTSLIGMHSALKSGEATVEEMFPVARPKADKPADLESRMDRLADEFAAGSSHSSTPSEEGPAASGPDVLSSGSAPAGAEPTPQHAPAGIASELEAKASAIAWLIDLAGDKELAVEEKLEQLDLRRPVVAETVPAAFLNDAVAAAAKWIRGELKPAAARKYLEGL